MPLYTEDTYHDRQVVRSYGSQDTTLIDTFEDITGSAITTKEVSEIGHYSVFVSVLLAGSLNNTIATIEILEDAVTLGETGIILRFAGNDIGYTVFFELTEVVCCKDLHLRIKTDKGVVTLTEYSFMIDGIPSTRVID